MDDLETTKLECMNCGELVGLDEPGPRVCPACGEILEQGPEDVAKPVDKDDTGRFRRIPRLR